MPSTNSAVDIHGDSPLTGPSNRVTDRVTDRLEISRAKTRSKQVVSLATPSACGAINREQRRELATEEFRGFASPFTIAQHQPFPPAIPPILISPPPPQSLSLSKLPPVSLHVLSLLPRFGGVVLCSVAAREVLSRDEGLPHPQGVVLLTQCVGGEEPSRACRECPEALLACSADLDDDVLPCKNEV